jgi:hypothetical protein
MVRDFFYLCFFNHEGHEGCTKVRKFLHHDSAEGAYCKSHWYNPLLLCQVRLWVLAGLAPILKKAPPDFFFNSDQISEIIK